MASVRQAQPCTKGEGAGGRERGEGRGGHVSPLRASRAAGRIQRAAARRPRLATGRRDPPHDKARRRPGTRPRAERRRGRPTPTTRATCTRPSAEVTLLQQQLAAALTVQLESDQLSAQQASVASSPRRWPVIGRATRTRSPGSISSSSTTGPSLPSCTRPRRTSRRTTRSCMAARTTSCAAGRSVRSKARQVVLHDRDHLRAPLDEQDATIAALEVKRDGGALPEHGRLAHLPASP